MGIIAYGSTHNAIIEARDQLHAKGIKTNYLRLRSLPLNGDVEQFLSQHDRIYVVEQNQQGQMLNLIRMYMPAQAAKMHAVLHYDGMPVDAVSVTKQIEEMESWQNRS